MDPLPLLTFSHLDWESIFQRPQHLMTRFGEWRDVLFIEQPTLRDGKPTLDVRSVAAGVQVCHPYLPVPGPAFGLQQEAMLVELLREHLACEGWDAFAAWLYTPMATRIARVLRPTAVFYDCTEEVSASRTAPPELIEREQELLGLADAVFTGGPNLYRAKKERHPFVRCFPSSVDLRHFSRAGVTPEPADQNAIPRPRLGFFGVIDERMDLELLEEVAAARPEWQIVLVGPISRLDPETLPRRANLHYLGQRPYQTLPAYAGGWDACLIPFAVNQATRFLSPTKCLEYMASDRPIVTTPLPDVTELYNDIVHTGADIESFLSACERAMSASAEEWQRRRARGQEVLRKTSWDTMARRMNDIVHYLGDPVGTRPGEIGSGLAWARGASA
jgi:UDP-galactopyranose mutase